MRIWLCRHRIAARTSSRFWAVGMTSVLVHGATVALALTCFLAPSATLALTVAWRLWVLASAAGVTSRPATTTAAMSFFVGTVATSLSRRVSGWRFVSTRRAVARILRPPGSLREPRGFAPRPRGAVCLYREAEPLVALLIGTFPRIFTALRYCLDSGAWRS